MVTLACSSAVPVEKWETLVSICQIPQWILNFHIIFFKLSLGIFLALCLY